MLTYRDIVVYVAGPFRAASTWLIEKNIRKAEELAWDVWAAGFTALCPHTNTRFYQHSLPDEVWLEGDLELLRRCDVVLLVPGWETSSGTKVEKEEALANGIPVVESIEHLREIGDLILNGEDHIQRGEE